MGAENLLLGATWEMTESLVREWQRNEYLWETETDFQIELATTEK